MYSGPIFRLLFTALCVLVLLLPASRVKSAESDCKYCHEFVDIGECIGVQDPSPGLDTLSNCRGTRLCYRYWIVLPDGTTEYVVFCRPYCFGDLCLWV